MRVLKKEESERGAAVVEHAFCLSILSMTFLILSSMGNLSSFSYIDVALSFGGGSSESTFTVDPQGDGDKSGH